MIAENDVDESTEDGQSRLSLLIHDLSELNENNPNPRGVIVELRKRLLRTIRDNATLEKRAAKQGAEMAELRKVLEPEMRASGRFYGIPASLDRNEAKKIYDLRNELEEKYLKFGPVVRPVLSAVVAFAIQQALIDKKINEGRTVEPKEVKEVHTAAVNAVSTLQRYTESGKEELIRAIRAETVVAVMRVLEGRAGASQPRLVQDILEDLSEEGLVPSMEIGITLG